MNVDFIRKYCLSFPEASENLQWGDDLCFKVRGKIFTVLGLKEVPQRVCFKVTPEAFAELVEREDIIPAPYLARYKWVLLERLDALPRPELEDLIRQSYDMVVSKAPKNATKVPRAKVPKKKIRSKSQSLKSKRKKRLR
ncbi:MAG TPA: MmcQ/YjbR family DNA-binding protein [Terriglobales bacterium]|jgi:predicted DNA-binding protein (MmcQ/YjbR family)